MSSDASKRQADAAAPPDSKKPKTAAVLAPAPEAKSAAEIYDPIAVDYAAIKTNPFKRHIEEGSFMSAVGDVDGKGVLDLACGSGYYSRMFKARGAEHVHGVDV